LLLRQRSQSTPLAQFSYSLLFDVQEDPDTIIEEIDAGVDPRVSSKDLQIAANDSSVPEKDSAIAETGISENDTCLSEGADISEKDIQPKKDRSVLQKDLEDDLRSIECNEGEIETTGVGIKQAALEDNKCKEGVCGDVRDELGAKMDKEKVDEFSSVEDEMYSDLENTSTENKVSLKSKTKEIITLEDENLGENVLGEGSMNEDMASAATDCLGTPGDTNIHVQVEECSQETGEHSLCQGSTIQDCRENGNVKKDSNAIEGLETKPKVKEKVSVDENRELKETLTTLEITQEVNVERTNTLEISQEVNVERTNTLEITQEVNVERTNTLEITQEVNVERTNTLEITQEVNVERTNTLEITQEVNVERTNISNEDEDEDEESVARSPSVKDRIMFFNSS
jgi:hypothetical protein